MPVNKLWIILAAVTVLCLAGPVKAADDGVHGDSIKTVKEKKIDGKVRQISPTEVTLEGALGEEKIPVNEIESITFGGDSALNRRSQ